MATLEIKLAGHNNYSTIVDEEDYRTFNLGSYKWHRMVRPNTTYVATYKNGKQIYLHRFILGLENAPRSVFVDHIDHNGLNNSRTNIRVTDNRGNQYNKHKVLSVKRTSCYKGVHLDRNNKTNPWRAGIRLLGKAKYLGCYRTQEEAARSYNQAATELFGPMAFLNVLPDQK